MARSSRGPRWPHVFAPVWWALVLSGCVVSAQFVRNQSQKPLRSILLRRGELPVSDDLRIQKRQLYDSQRAVHMEEFGAASGAATELLEGRLGPSSSHWFVHVKGPITQKYRHTLEAHIAPYQLDHYVPHNTFLVLGPSPGERDFVSFRDRLEGAPGVMLVMELEADMKVHPALRTDSNASHDKTHLVARISEGFRHLVSSDQVRRWEDSLSHHLYSTSAFRAARRNLERPSSGSVLRMELHQPAWAALDGATQQHPHLISVHLPNQRAAESAAQWLSQLPEVEWVEPLPRFRLLNEFAKFVVQAGDDFTAPSTEDDSSLFTFTPAFDHGVNGTGQIVALADTGVDFDSCFFADSHVDSRSVRTDGTLSADHRKIAYYLLLANNGVGDEVEGHGTHVAGSIAGAMPNDASDVARETLSRHNGMAPGARLAVVDIKRANSDELFIPVDFYAGFYRKVYERAGARISSNSWGAPGAAYSSYSLDTDRFTYEHPDFLPVFAAGNYGEGGFKTVTDPGVSKNALTVGSCKNVPDSWVTLGHGSEVIVVDTTTGSSSLAGMRLPIVPAQFGRRLRLNALGQQDSGSGVPLSAAQPIDACSNISNADAVRDAAVLVVRGGCPFTDKALHLERAGALIMMLVDTDDDPEVMGTAGDVPIVFLPSVSVGHTRGQRLLDAVEARLGSGPQLSLVGPVMSASRSDLSPDVRSTFSSLGPTLDGRLKPEVLAPGQMIVSARSDGHIDSNQCPLDGTAVIDMEGTSMATPIAAGSVALLRQYFMEGFYPSGSRRAADAFTPTGALLKAAVINSAVAMAGSPASRDPSREPPDFYQGYGRMQLGNVMVFADGDSLVANKRRGRVLFVEQDRMITTSEQHHYCFRLEPSFSASNAELPPLPFKATIAWMDPPAHSISSFMLINDVDLAVSAADDGTVWTGNAGLVTTSSTDTGSNSGTGGRLWDYQNSNEHVTVSQPGHAGRLLSVSVIGTHVPKGPQAYALVVTGSFQRLEPGECAGAVLCPDHCGSLQGRGQCDGQLGVCRCSPDWHGIRCDVPSHALMPDLVPRPDPAPDKNDEGNPKQVVHASWSAVRVRVPSQEWRYFHLDATNGSEIQQMRKQHGASLRVSLESVSEDPDLFVGRDAFPDQSSFAWLSVKDDPKGEKTRITINNEELETGRYVIGVTAFCCGAAEFDLVVRLGVYPFEEHPTDGGGPCVGHNCQDTPTGSPHASKPWDNGLGVGLGILGGLFVLGLLVTLTAVAIRRRRARRQQAVAAALQQIQGFPDIGKDQSEAPSTAAPQISAQRAMKLLLSSLSGGRLGGGYAHYASAPQGVDSDGAFVVVHSDDEEDNSDKELGILGEDDDDGGGDEAEEGNTALVPEDARSSDGQVEEEKAPSGHRGPEARTSHRQGYESLTQHEGDSQEEKGAPS